MKERRRPRQVGDVVRAELARLLRVELSDPNIGFATITDVQMSPDLRDAKVYFSVFGPADQFDKTLVALNHAASHLRGLVGRNCGLRNAPSLRFIADHTLERGARIEQLLRTIPKPVTPEDEPPAEASADVAASDAPAPKDPQE